MTARRTCTLVLLLAALAACAMLAVSASAMSPAESILLEARQRHAAEAAASKPDVTSLLAVASVSDSHHHSANGVSILSKAEAEAEARFEMGAGAEHEVEAHHEAEHEAGHGVDAEASQEVASLAAAESDAKLESNTDIENHFEHVEGVDAFHNAELDGEMEARSEDAQSMLNEGHTEQESALDASMESEGSLLQTEVDARQRARFAAENEADSESESESEDEGELEADSESDSESDSEAEYDNESRDSEFYNSEERDDGYSYLETRSRSQAQLEAEQQFEAANQVNVNSNTEAEQNAEFMKGQNGIQSGLAPQGIEASAPAPAAKPLAAAAPAPAAAAPVAVATAVATPASAAPKVESQDASLLEVSRKKSHKGKHSKGHKRAKKHRGHLSRSQPGEVAAANPRNPSHPVRVRLSKHLRKSKKDKHSKLKRRGRKSRKSRKNKRKHRKGKKSRKGKNKKNKHRRSKRSDSEQESEEGSQSEGSSRSHDAGRGVFTRKEKMARATTMAAKLNSKLLKKGEKYMKKWSEIEVPDPGRPGRTVKVKVQVRVPAPAVPKVELKTEVRRVRVPDLKHPGHFVQKELTIKRAFKNIRQAVVDPLNPGHVRTIDVKIEVPAPHQKPKKAFENQAAILQKHIRRLEKSVQSLEPQLALAQRKKHDSPVLEDGAPAPPDRQQVKMAQDLYKVLDATVMHKAGQIGQQYLEDARNMVLLASNNHQANADFNDAMNEEMLLPKPF